MGNQCHREFPEGLSCQGGLHFGMHNSCEAQLAFLGMGQNARFPAISHGDLLHDTSEASLPMEKKMLDFEAMGAVPTGWALSRDDPPHGVLALGGSACLIYQNEPDPPPEGEAVAQTPKMKMLLALPDWAVDVPRAQSIVQYASNLAGLRNFCRLTRITRAPRFNHVVFECDLPRGKSLESWLDEHGYLDEETSQELFRELLQTMASLHRTSHSIISLWGLLHPSMVYLGPGGDLVSVMPVGCLLSFAGAKSCGLTLCDSMTRHWLPPELDRAIITSDRSLIVDPSARSAADTFSAAAVVLHAMQQVAPDGLRDKKVLVLLPEPAVDLFSKVLYVDFHWRATCADALDHPWLCDRKSMKRAITRSVTSRTLSI